MSNISKMEPEDAGNIELRDGTSVPLEMVQKIFSEVNGSDEALSRIVYDDHIVTKDNVQQLLIQLIQAANQYQLQSDTLRITILRTDDNQTELNCLESLNQLDPSPATPIEAIVIEYQFLLRNPITNKLQSYDVEVGLISRAAKRFKAAKSHGVDVQMMRLRSSMSGKFEVSYSEYLVGKFLMSTIENWYNSVEKSTKSFWPKFIERHNAWVPLIFRLMGTAAFCICVWLFRDSIFAINFTNSQVLLSGLILFVTFSIVIATSLRLGSGFLSYVERLYPVSAIKFADAEEKILRQYNKANSSIATKSFLYLAGQVISSLIVSWIGALMTVETLAKIAP
ncbi:hypothetical protein BBF93_18650 [Hyphomonas sp. CACIAM 19H1]|uniref:hypothetical protein n=1 Tax=Hyphomonas sp. CACIAM 19H1 TaxID=1873716 RepID=UPI000DEDFFF7|nr:hypothetical protein [Hyphomonas sp. CACIAM 19H1]AXE66029.1 hypothetical protein BBF93_18650 [Hyphomonas sp. CACIAM 19H1]